MQGVIPQVLRSLLRKEGSCEQPTSPLRRHRHPSQLATSRQHHDIDGGPYRDDFGRDACLAGWLRLESASSEYLPLSASSPIHPPITSYEGCELTIPRSTLPEPSSSPTFPCPHQHHFTHFRRPDQHPPPAIPYLSPLPTCPINRPNFTHLPYPTCPSALPITS